MNKKLSHPLQTSAEEPVDLCAPRDMSDRLREMIQWQQEIEVRLIDCIKNVSGIAPCYSELPAPECHLMAINLLEEITNSNVGLSSKLQELLK